MNAYIVSSFSSELEKNAALPQLLQKIREHVPHAIGKIWGSGAGRALAGGAVGAAGGALTAPPEERGTRAILGGLLGAGAGYASPLLTRAGRARAAEHAKYLGRKAKHEITGRGAAPVQSGSSPEALAELRKAEAAGLTSIPGVAKAMYRRPLGTMREAWRQSGRLGKAMTLADVAMSVPHIRDPNTEAGTGEKVLGTLGRTSGYLLGGRMGLLGGSILGGGLGYVGGKAGKIFGGGTPRLPQAAPSPYGALEEYVPQRTRMMAEQAGRLIGPGQE